MADSLKVVTASRLYVGQDTKWCKGRYFFKVVAIYSATQLAPPQLCMLTLFGHSLKL